MSTQKGNATRTRVQKYKNRTAFKNDLHDKRPQQKRINSLHISEVCQHCKDVIEWKIKYKKYKPLSQPKTCTRCQQRNIRKAYHVLCRDCARETHVCAKCLKSAEEVEIEPAQPTPEEELKLKVEMERLVKSFPERKRRAFQRYMDKGKKDLLAEAAEREVEEEEEDDGATDDEAGEEKVKEVKPKAPRVPHSREELLQKIKQLQLLVGSGDNDDFGSDEDSEDFSDSDEDDEEEEEKNPSV